MVKDSQTVTRQVDKKRALAFGMIMLLIMLIAASISSYLSLALQKKEEDRFARTIGTILGASINKISFSGRHHSRLLLEEMQQILPELAYISVETLDGTVVAHTDRTRNDSVVGHEERLLSRRSLELHATILSEQTLNGAAVKEVLLPYHTGINPEPAGVVRVGIRVDETRRKQKSNLFVGLFMIISATISAIWIMERLSTYFSKRLTDSELALRRSEDFARTLLDIPTVTVFIIDRQGICLDANDTLLARVAASREKVIGSSIWPFFPPQVAELRQKKVRQVLDTKKPLRYEDEYQGMWNDHYLKPVLGSNDEVEQVVMLGLDITDRKRAENDLRASTARLARMAATIPGVLYDYVRYPDGTSRFLYLSPRFTEIFGLPVEDALANIGAIWACFHPDDMEQFRKKGEEANLKADEFNTELRIITPTGIEKTLQFAAKRHPALSDGGLLWSGLILDITLKKAAEQLLRRERNRNERASVAAKVALWECDLETGRLHWSSYIEQMLDTRTCPVPVTMEEFINIFHSEDREQLEKAISASQQTHMPLNHECRLPLADGSFAWWHFLGKTELAVDGKSAIMAGACVDITERKSAEEERQRLTQQMLHVQKLESLGLLAGGIAHDFNNILCVILGNTEMAMTGLGPDSQEMRFLQEVEKATRKAAGLAGQMLAYSGKGLFVIRRIDLNQIIQDMTGMLEVSISKKASLRFALYDGLPAIQADETQIRQIILNLVINASEAIGENAGVIYLSTDLSFCTEQFFSDFWLDTTLPTETYVTLTVADSGCGMDNQTLARIFDPFFTTKFTGRGLGMAAVQGIVKAHKGAVQVESRVGEGSIFRVFLPASNHPVEPANPYQHSSGRNWQGDILLVEDEAAIRQIGSEVLNHIGFTVTTACDGIEAVEIFQKNPEFRCIILDLTMPRLDGLQTFRELLRIRPDVPVIIASGYHEQDVAERFEDTQPAGFIQKPYSISIIKEVIGKVLVD